MPLQEVQIFDISMLTVVYRKEEKSEPDCGFGIFLLTFEHFRI